jgi:hypothetical protein
MRLQLMLASALLRNTAVLSRNTLALQRNRRALYAVFCHSLASRFSVTTFEKM